MLLHSFLFLLFVAAIVAAVLWFPSLRLRFVTPFILGWFRRVVPPISETERAALEAGSPGFESEVFAGKINWNEMQNPELWPQLSAEEKAFLDEPVQELCAMVDPWQLSREQDLPEEVWKFLAEQGFFGMIIPKEYGGKGFSAYGHATIIKTIATRDVSLAVTVMVPNSLGPAELLLHFGTDAQKKYYLNRLARGEEFPCFALTGPTAGSDAASLPDSGTVTMRDGVLGIVVNWDKRYITLAPRATVVGLAFKLKDPDRLLGGKTDYGITCALIPRETEGVEIGARHNPLDLGFLNGPIRGKNVFIPIDAVIGGRDGVGKGWEMLMSCLSVGRAISLPSLSVGAGWLTSFYVGAYAAIRKQFGLPIGKFEGIRVPLAEMAGTTYMMEAASRTMLGRIDKGEASPVISAILKYSLTERMRKIVNHGMDILGGAAIQIGPRNIMARIYSAIPVAITVEGANILTRNLIIFGQGAFRSHPFIYREIKAAQRKDAQGLLEFDEAFWSHVKFTVKNIARVAYTNVTRKFAEPDACRDGARPYYRAISRLTLAFTVLADASFLIMGGALKRAEMISGRFADIQIALVLASATLRRFEATEDHSIKQQELALVRWSCETLLAEAGKAFDEILSNYPNKYIGMVLRAWLFPFGINFKAPSDELVNQVAEIALVPSAMRNELTAGVFIPQAGDEAVARMQRTFTLVVSADEIVRRISAAKKAGTLDSKATPAEAVAKAVITSSEATLLKEADKARNDIIQVDEFKRIQPLTSLR